jgi:hypothetical protein
VPGISTPSGVDEAAGEESTDSVDSGEQSCAATRARRGDTRQPEVAALFDADIAFD